MESVWQWMWGFLVPVIGWQIKKNHSLTKDLADHRLHVAEQYVNKSDFRDIMAKIERTLERIETKIDRKADK